MPFYIFEAHKKHYEKFADGSTQEIDVPYDIPDTWGWVRFSTLVEIVRGGSPRPIKDYLTSEVDGINWIKIGDTEKGEKYINNVKEKIKKSGLNKTRFVKKGTFLLTNSMSFGRPYILNVDGAIHDGWLAISNYENSLNKDYLFYILSSNVVYSQFLSLISGAVVKNLNNDKVASILIPLPPLAEQQRIIEVIESALEKVDEYAESYNQLQKLDKIFPDKLKKSILQYAMQGKLVEQDPNDESVEVLLEKIRAEKQKLFEEGKIKKKDLDISIVSQGDDNSYYEEVPYKIPENWEWVKLGSIGIWNSGATPPKANCSYYSSATIPWLLTGDLTDSYITNIPNKISELALKETSVKVNPTGSILIAMYGATVGKLGILTFPATTNQACCACSKLFQIEKLYLFYFLMAERNNFKFRAEGGAQPNISKNKIINTFIPLPPLPEQSRIVDKIEQSFAHIDALI